MTDERLERLYRQAWERSPQGQYETFGTPARYGTGIDWNDFPHCGSNGSRTTKPPDTHLAYNPAVGIEKVSLRLNSLSQRPSDYN